MARVDIETASQTVHSIGRMVPRAVFTMIGHFYDCRDIP